MLVCAVIFEKNIWQYKCRGQNNFFLIEQITDKLDFDKPATMKSKMTQSKEVGLEEIQL